MLLLVLNCFFWSISKNKNRNECLNKDKREEDVIISLTSFPGRINIVWQTIITLLNQTYKPDRIILWLAYSQFKDVTLPKKLTQLKNYGLEIYYCEDYRSYKKLLPTLNKFPNSIIITVDDDAFYNRNMVKRLMDSYFKNKEIIHCHRVTHVLYKKGNHSFVIDDKGERISFNNKIVGIGGVLYPPKSLSLEVLEYDKAFKLAPTNDDIWFWFMALRNKTKICYVDGAFFAPSATFGSLKTEKLSEINDCDDGLFYKCLNDMVVYYPDCADLLAR